MSKPIISIIIPCYNQSRYLDECLQSVLDQIWTDWECIVVNDGSPDDAELIAQKWVSKDDRFKYVFQENRGVSAARNLGITIANGEFILPLDADDKIGNLYLSLAIKAFNKNANLELVYCKAEKFGDEKGSWDLEPFTLYNLSVKNMIFCSAFYRKKDWERVGGYDVNMTQGLEDWEFWISILKNSGYVLCLDYIGFFYRIKKISRQSQLSPENTEKLYDYLSVKHVGFFIANFGSFYKINNKFKAEKNFYNKKLKSKKFVINLFCKTFFNFQPFARHKIE